MVQRNNNTVQNVMNVAILYIQLGYHRVGRRMLQHQVDSRHQPPDIFLCHIKVLFLHRIDIAKVLFSDELYGFLYQCGRGAYLMCQPVHERFRKFRRHKLVCRLFHRFKEFRKVLKPGYKNIPSKRALFGNRHSLDMHRNVSAYPRMPQYGIELNAIAGLVLFREIVAKELFYMTLYDTAAYKHLYRIVRVNTNAFPCTDDDTGINVVKKMGIYTRRPGN
ncbi:MAG: hypothetical protein C4541_08805 [Candidatus Auribacter fodinae]|uniref:Uncharacterized protein n=1 Tax=Candidatus Auribacter fodinae TaxID=2093366 RepID=A0A3A4R741_9BACT|nr:MAG: hypothetical protein C4541_08805 [Candidatus Auribacter fodinae]